MQIKSDSWSIVENNMESPTCLSRNIPNDESGGKERCAMCGFSKQEMAVTISAIYEGRGVVLSVFIFLNANISILLGCYNTCTIGMFLNFLKRQRRFAL